MSRNVAKTLPIGPVQLYWNDVRLGSPKTAATIRYTKDTVQPKDEESGQSVMSHKTGEMCEVDVVINDFKVEQMRYAYDQATGYATPGTINTVNYTATVLATFRYKETHTLDGTDSETVDGAGWESGTVKVFKSDYSNGPAGYVSGTDYTSTSSVGNLARIAAGDITDGETVIVEYNQSATSSVVYGGGDRSDFEAVLRLVHITDDGKLLQFYAYRAKKIGASDVAIQMATEFAGIPMTFHCLADLSRTPGQQMFKWNKET